MDWNGFAVVEAQTESEFLKAKAVFADHMRIYKLDQIECDENAWRSHNPARLRFRINPRTRGGINVWEGDEWCGSCWLYSYHSDRFLPAFGWWIKNSFMKGFRWKRALA